MMRVPGIWPRRRRLMQAQRLWPLARAACCGSRRGSGRSRSCRGRWRCRRASFPSDHVHRRRHRFPRWPAPRRGRSRRQPETTAASPSHLWQMSRKPANHPGKPAIQRGPAGRLCTGKGLLRQGGSSRSSCLLGVTPAHLEGAALLRQPYGRFHSLCVAGMQQQEADDAGTNGRSVLGCRNGEAMAYLNEADSTPPFLR